MSIDFGFKDIKFWQVVYVARLCSFMFTSGQCSSKDQYVMIAWMLVPLQVTMVDFTTVASLDFRATSLVQL